MHKKEARFFWGKFLFYVIILNFIILNSTTREALSYEQNSNSINSQSTTIIIETSGPVAYKSHLFNEPPHLVLTFNPQSLSAEFKREISVNRGMVKKIYCRYYEPQSGAERWLKSITFALIARTGYKVTESDGKIFISIQNTPEQSINSTWADELVIKEHAPRGWGSIARREALKAALKSVRIKRQSAGIISDGMLTVVDANNLTPVQMITVGTKALLAGDKTVSVGDNLTVSRGLINQTPALKEIESATGKNLPMTLAGFAGISLAFLSLMWGILAVDKFKSPKKIVPKNEKKIIEELFLKEEELQKWPKYYRDAAPPETDIAERRKFPRADVSNARGILNRALVGSKTQPFKNIKVNDISKGGLCFSVKSRETKFRSPTIIKLYFANSTKPIDLWVKVVWENDITQSEGKNVGVKFTKVPKESWEKIMESFGHRLGLNGVSA